MSVTCFCLLLLSPHALEDEATRMALDRHTKALADSKKAVYDEDLIALVAAESTRNVRDRYELTYLNVTSSSMAVPHATVKIRIDGEEHVGHAAGDGMVDACFKALSDLTGMHPHIVMVYGNPVSKSLRHSVAVNGECRHCGELSCVFGVECLVFGGRSTFVLLSSARPHFRSFQRASPAPRPTAWLISAARS